MRARRDALGLSREALARLASCSASAINKVERGEMSPSPRLVGRLAGALACEVADLYEPDADHAAWAADVAAHLPGSDARFLVRVAEAYERINEFEAAAALRDQAARLGIDAEEGA
nr:MULTISPECIES: helix-turn-helix transcriptional regulator [unclassified Nocardiopsis]